MFIGFNFCNEVADYEAWCLGVVVFLAFWLCVPSAWESIGIIVQKPTNIKGVS
ncbi:MAG: hypothetical protein LBJ00_09885 [Planctomycetaceae bacterium]|nr:hypothetical protein [Planctomycetaceae bacterium]